MELQPYVDDLREQLLAAASGAGDDANDAALRMTHAMDAATRLVLLEVLTVAADEISVDLAPGSVEVRLKGRDPQFVVTGDLESAASAGSPPVPESAPTGVSSDDDGASARVTLRLPEHLKSRIEHAAGRESLSVNAWLVRALTAATSSPAASSPPPPPSAGQSYRGWVR